MKIANALDRFGRQLAANGRSGHTQAAYRRDVEALSRWLSPGKVEGMGDNPDLSAVTLGILARFQNSNAALCAPHGQLLSGIQSEWTGCVRKFHCSTHPDRADPPRPGEEK